jgi:hypothetical protein
MQKVTSEYQIVYNFVKHFNVRDIRAPVTRDSEIVSQAGLGCSVIFCFVCVWVGCYKESQNDLYSGVIPRSCFELYDLGICFRQNSV